MVLIRSTYLQTKFELNFEVEVLWNLTSFYLLKRVISCSVRSYEDTGWSLATLTSVKYRYVYIVKSHTTNKPSNYIY